MRESTQDAELSQSEFDGSLEAHLVAGFFRAVLDEAPPELINLMGFLEAVTSGMSFDLIAVNSYKIGDHRIAVPQRLDPERRVDAGIASSTRPARRTTSGHLEPGVQPFRDLLSDTPEEYRPTLTLMADWTEELASTNHNITAAPYFGLAGDVSLLPRLKDENVGLVTLWRYNGGKPAISFWRSVSERRAP